LELYFNYNGVGIINAPSAEEYEEMFQERLMQKRSKEGKPLCAKWALHR